MNNRFLIADQTVQVEDSALSALLTGFESDSENQSASGPCDQEPICSVGIASIPPLHGVEQLDSDYDVRHVLTLTRHPDAVLLADDLFTRVTLRSRYTDGLSDLLLLTLLMRDRTSIRWKTSPRSILPMVWGSTFMRNESW